MNAILAPILPCVALSVAVALATPVPAPAATIQVPGTHPSVTAALAVATDGDVVQVAEGTFSPSTTGELFPLVVPDGVTLEGAGAGLSVLDAEGTASVIRIDAASTGTARVTGFTITGGSADRGGGVQIEGGSPEIAHNLILANVALLRGSGINVQGDATPWIHHNVVWESTDLDLDHFGDPHGIQCGIESAGLIEHNLVGRTDSNGLFVQESAAPTIRHNIFYENGIEGWRGRGICNFGAAGTVIAHNLFHGNVISALVMRDASGTIVNVSAVQADALFADDGLYGNLDGDPLFTDVAALDFTLQPTSPAIDAGDPTVGLDPDGSAPDLGPFPRLNTVAAPPARSAGVRITGNVPNPFNPATEIRFVLERPASVVVEVVDPRGRRVRHLHAGRLDAGARQVRWDGRDDAGRAVASGLYLVRVGVDGVSATHGMMLVR